MKPIPVIMTAVRCGCIVGLALFAGLARVRAKEPSQEKSNMKTLKSRCSDGSRDRADAPGNRLKESEAIARAAQRLGLSRFPRIRASARLVVLDRNTVPFLGEILAGKQSWQVDFDGLDLQQQPGGQELRNPHITKLRVLLAPGSGEVLKIESQAPANETPTMRLPTAAEEEQQLNKIHTTYALPSQQPGVAFLDALTVSVGWGREVRHLRAYYVVQSSPAPEERPVWVIESRGALVHLPISLFDGQSEPHVLRQASALRDVVDANNGKWLSADTVVQSRSRELR